MAVRMHYGVRAERAVADDAIRPEAHAVAEHDSPFEHDADVDEHVAADDDLAAHVEPVGIRERHAALHELRGLPALQYALGGRELSAIVDAEHLGR